MAIDEGIIGALVALAPSVIVGAGEGGQRDQGHQQQGQSEPAASLFCLRLGCLLARSWDGRRGPSGVS